MKHYNIQNYIRYKKDLETTLNRLEDKAWSEYSRDELIVKFMPLVENLARKFATSQQASGVMAITDMIQEGHLNLIKAVDRIDWDKINESEDSEKTLKSFLSKRIKGGIRRAVDTNRGQMRLPEHVTNSIRKNFGKDKKAVAMFFNSIFLSIDAGTRDDDDLFLQIEDKSEPYNQVFLNMYLTSLLKQHLIDKEKKVAQRLSETPVEMVRARNENGHFIKDDPKTEENESWIEKSKVKKKAVAKKKTTAKKSK